MKDNLEQLEKKVLKKYKKRDKRKKPKMKVSGRSVFGLKRNMDKR